VRLAAPAISAVRMPLVRVCAGRGVGRGGGGGAWGRRGPGRGSRSVPRGDRGPGLGRPLPPDVAINVHL